VASEVHQSRLVGGELNSAIANAVVRIHREQVGRGAARVQATARPEAVVVLLQDVLTKAEQSLVAVGEQDAVVELRRRCYAVMEFELVAEVERLTGSAVTACLNDAHVEPDVSVLVFVLAGSTAGSVLGDESDAVRAQSAHAQHRAADLKRSASAIAARAVDAVEESRRLRPP
jgi:uncharacterized protein YbcI